MKKNKKSLIAGIGAAIGVVLAASMAQIFFNPSLEKILLNTAEEANTSFPMQIDQYLRVDSASVSDRKTFQYHYTLIDMEKSEVNIDTVNKYIRPEVINNVRSNPELKFFRKKKVTLDYRYYDKNGEPVYTITVTPDMYNEE